MIAAIKNADPRVKAVSIFANRSQTVIDEVNKAAREKGIHIVWINQAYVRLNPPSFTAKTEGKSNEDAI